MPEWWPFLAVFWTLYLIDGIRGGRRDRIGFRGATGRPSAHVAQAAWHMPLPLPTAWGVVVEDLPCSLAPAGLTNWPSGSAARPPPLPDAVVSFRWEDIREITTSGGWIRINGRRFAPTTPALDASGLKRLTSRLAPLALTARAAALHRWQTHRFRPLRQRRRLRTILGRSRGLAELNTAQTLLLLLLTIYLLIGGPERVPAELRDRIAAALPWWLAGYAVLHTTAVGWFWRLHRELRPEQASERLGLVMTALLVPPQALRLRHHLVAGTGGAQHPLATALAIGEPGAAAQVARNTLADLRWPRVPSRLPTDARQIAASAAALIEPAVEQALVTARPELTPNQLLARPTAASVDACAWCPRCGDQFVRMDASCPHGVPLQPLTRVDQERG